MMLLIMLFVVFVFVVVVVVCAVAVFDYVVDPTACRALGRKALSLELYASSSTSQYLPILHSTRYLVYFIHSSAIIRTGTMQR